VTVTQPEAAIGPVHRSVTAKEIVECIVQTLQRAIAEVPNDEVRDEHLPIWENILNLGTEALE
jgi:hypothetical protein